MNPSPLPPTKNNQNSYTYWIDPQSKSHQLPPQHHPQKLLQPIEPPLQNQGPSPWNCLGTWEQRKILLKQLVANVNAEIREFIGRLAELEGLQLEGLQLEGDAYKVFKKNKWNVMYELMGSIKCKKQQKNGQILITEISSIGDRQFEVVGDEEIKLLIEPHADTFIKIIEGALQGHQH